MKIIQTRVEHHRLKLQGYRFKVVYQRGAENTADYNSRHPLPLSEDLSEPTEDTLYINSVIDQDLPDAVTLEMMQTMTNQDDTLAKLKHCILEKGHIPATERELQEYKSVFQELSVARQLVMRGMKIVVPSALQADIIALSHLARHCEGKNCERFFVK